MRTTFPCRGRSMMLPACLFLLLVSALPVIAQVNGALQTTTSDGSVVNGNIYTSKDAVYITGGPQNEHANGLVPDGNYYFQVTDPGGATLLSTDDVSCREVTVSGGKITGVYSDSACTTGYHSLGTFNTLNGEMPVQLVPYNDTPNPGGEYKAWLTPVANYSLTKTNCSSKNSNITFGFCDSDSKTDNFKIKPNVAHVTVCKFNDLNDDSVQQSGEPLLPHWPITATGVDNDSMTNTTVNTQTGDSGCVTFAVSTFSNQDGTQTVTLKEGTFGPDWAETAPLNGTCTPTGNNSTTPNANDTCSVTDPTITLTISSGDDISAPNFGNNNPFCNTTGCTAQGLVVSKNANPSFSRKFTWGITKSVDKTTIDTAGSATFNYTVNVTHDSGTDSGWQVTGDIKVANPTGADITGVTVSDAVDDGGSCTVDTFDGTVPAGSHVDVPYTCTYSSAPSPATGTNTATAAWGNGNTAPGTAAFDFGGATPTAVDGSVTVTDTLGGTLGTVLSTDPSPTTFNYSKTFSDTPGTCTSHNNTATFTTNTTGSTGSGSQTVKACVGADLGVSKTATPSFNSGISKSVDKAEIDTNSGGSATFNYTVTVTESGWKVSGNIMVTNPNDWEAVTANIGDALSDSGASCSFTGGSTVTLAAGGSASVPYTCTFSSAPAGSGNNTATVSWDKVASFTPDGSGSGTAGYTFGSLTVTDTIGGTLGTISTPTASTTYTYNHTVTAPAGTCTTIPNTASITGTSQSASKSVKVCGASDLTVLKTAVASFTPSITKTGPTSPVENKGSSILNYSVTVNESGWMVTGAITVTNPNDWEDIPVSINDSLSASGAICTAPPGGIVLRTSSATVPYQCTFAAAPAANGVNTATASWANAHTLDSSAMGVAPYAFSSLTVTDTFNGGTAKTLGTISVPTSTTTYTDSYTVPASPPGACVTYPNTTTIIGTTQSASYAVPVCNPTTGALTMGFWQNNNGQGIITKSCGGTSGTSLMAFLAGVSPNGFNPFRDDTATTCTTEAMYVYNIIKAASCTSSASTCNSMLRAQMLATALDVYFSTPSLGGNKIGAYSGLGSNQPALGGVAIDLSTVHPCTDSSSGSTCTSTKEDVRPEYGIAAPCLGTTVGQMLGYSNYTPSALNGSPVATATTGATWYNQNKGRQVYAKDGFDNTNNQIANIAPSSCNPSF